MLLPSLYIIIVHIIELYYLILSTDSKTYQYKNSSVNLKNYKNIIKTGFIS